MSKKSEVYIVSSDCKVGSVLTVESRENNSFKIKCNPFQNRPNQKWYFDGNMFISLSNGLALTYDVKRGKLGLSTPTGGIVQLWVIKKKGILTKVDGKAIDLVQNIFGSTKGNVVACNNHHGRLNQRWTVIKLKDYVMGKEKLYSKMREKERKWTFHKVVSPSLRNITKKIDNLTSMSIGSETAGFEDEDDYFQKLDYEKGNEKNPPKRQNMNEHQKDEEEHPEKSSSPLKRISSSSSSLSSLSSSDAVSSPHHSSESSNKNNGNHQKPLPPLPPNSSNQKKEEKKKEEKDLMLKKGDFAFVLERKRNRKQILILEDDGELKIVKKDQLEALDRRCCWKWDKGILKNLRNGKVLEYNPQKMEIFVTYEKDDSSIMQKFNFNGFSFSTRFDGCFFGVIRGKITVQEREAETTKWILNPL